MTRFRPLNVPAGSAFSTTFAGSTLNVPSWGSPAGAGNLTPQYTIIGDGIAPAQVHFDIPNLATAGFQFPAVPAGSLYWDRYAHDLCILWTVFAPSYSYTKVSNIRPEWNNPNLMFGPEPSALLRENGNWLVRAEAWDMYGGYDYGEVTVPILGIGAGYDGSNTFVGAEDSVFTGAPAAAQQRTSFDTLLNDLENLNGTKGRIVLKGGSTFPAVNRGLLQNNFPNLRIETVDGFGTGRANITFVDQRALFRIRPSEFTQDQCATFKGLNILGPYDGATETGLTDRDRPAFIESYGGDHTITDCVVDGMANGQRMSGNAVRNMMWHDSEIVNFFNYGIYATSDGTLNGKLSVLGTSIRHKDDNLSGGGGDGANGQQHGPYRAQTMRRAYWDIFETFSTASNDSQGNPNGPSHAAGPRDHRNSLDGLGAFFRGVIEGGDALIAGGVAASGLKNPCNRLIEFVDFICSGQTRDPIDPGVGTTMRNFTVHRMNVEQRNGSFNEWFGVGDRQYIELENITSAFVAGETITASNGSTASIIRISGDDYYVENVTGPFPFGLTVTGSIAGQATVKRNLDTVYQNYVEPYEIYQGTLVNYKQGMNLLAPTINGEKQHPPTLRDLVVYAPNGGSPNLGDLPLDITLMPHFTPRSRGSAWRNYNGLFTPVEQLTFTYESGNPTHRLAYDGGSAAFSIRELVTGATSGATGYVNRVDGSTASGDLYLIDVQGDFLDNEALTSTGGAAVVNGVLQKEGIYDHVPAPGSTAYQTGAVFGSGVRTSRWNIKLEVRGANPSQGAY